MSRVKQFSQLILSVACMVFLSPYLPSSNQVTAGQSATAVPEFISAEQLKRKVTEGEALTIIDVRDTDAYINSARIKGSLHIKLRRLSYRLSMPPLKELPRDREVITFCACPHDEAGIRAAQIFLDAGFKRVRVLQGGWQMWLKVNGPTESRPRA